MEKIINCRIFYIEGFLNRRNDQIAVERKDLKGGKYIVSTYTYFFFNWESRNRKLNV